ncbi:hypothetical protein, partial [Oenococcus sp.]|uniref:hypothetical protein n=1 Tax=Oenococcus sp. TaxID=1979414 RepID=UPI0039EB704E
MIDKKIVYQCISDLAEEDTTQNNINRVSLTSLHEKLMTYYPDLALASLHRELINLNNEGKIKYGGWDDAQGTPTTNDLIEIKSLFNDKAFQGNEVSLKTMSFQFSLEDCFIILDKFNSRIPVIGTDFINQHRELIEYLRDMKLFSGVPKDGGDGLAYWNKPELSGKGHILFKRLYAYLLLKAICTKQTLGSLTLNASDLSIFHFLMKAGLISYGGIQQSVKAPGGTIIAPNQITIEDAGYELLDNQSPEEIYNFFDENAKKGSSMNINNIHVNGNPMFG